MAELEAEYSDSEDKETVAVIPRPFGSEKNMGQSHDKNQPAENADADPLQPIQSKENYIGCWLPHLNMCKVTCNSKILTNFLHCTSHSTKHCNLFL